MAIKTRYAHLYARGGRWWLRYYNPITSQLVRDPTGLQVGPDDETAALLRNKYNELLMNRKDPKAEFNRAEQLNRAKAMPFRGLYELFMERQGTQRSLGMQKRYRVFFNAIAKTTLADEPIGSITQLHIEEYLRLRKKEDGISNATYNREFSFFHVVFGKAVRWKLLAENPANGIEKLPESGKREVRLAVIEAQELIKALSHPWDSITEFALYTGWRAGNILGLKIEDIQQMPNRVNPMDPAAKATLRNMKGGRTEVFPLSDAAMEVATRCCDGRCSGPVFVGPISGKPFSQVSETFYKTVRRLELTVEVDGEKTPLRFHDLRHVVATWLREGQHDAETRRLLLGHRNVTMTELYTTYDRMLAGRALQTLPRLRASG